MIQKLILHIPHSSTHIPFTDGFDISQTDLQNEILKLTNWHTEDLFSNINDISIVADFSRLFCDPERFVDDEVEVMAEYGMCVLYETTDEGKIMRKVSAELRDRIIREYYIPHHAKFEQAVEEQLEERSKAMIMDCHSFTDIPFKRDLDKTPDRPDICIGKDDYHTPQDLIDISVNYFQSHGLTVKLNSPYAETIVPLKYYQADKRVLSIMIEINRKLYLEDGSSKSQNYDTVKEVIQGYLGMLRQ